MAKNNSDNNKENKKSIIKKVLAAFVLVDLIVGIVFLICYFNGSIYLHMYNSSKINKTVQICRKVVLYDPEMQQSFVSILL